MAKKNKDNVVQLFQEVNVPTVYRQPVTTVSRRKADLLQDLADLNEDRLDHFQATLGEFLELATTAIAFEDDSAKLLPAGQNTLMAQYLAARDIGEFVSVIRDRIKEYAFDHMDTVLDEKGVTDPAAHNAEIEVPIYGMQFKREAAGYADPTIDEEKLKVLLGERWKEVYTEETIPAKKVFVLNEDALINLLHSEPEMVEKLREVAVPGELKAGRLNVRNMT